ncbi:MAG: septum formation initiator family protein [Desulfovibrionaceae bacterium]
MVRRVVLAGLVLVNVVLLWGLVASDHGVFAYLDLKDRHDRLVQDTAEADRTSRVLSREIRLLTSDAAYQEKVVRERLNYVREDEVLYLFPGPSAEPGKGGTDASEN